MAGDPRYANSSKRKRVRKQVLNEESTCHLCDQHVNVKLAKGLPGSPELDELTPIAHGGNPYARDNIRLAHRHCNQQRSDGTIHEARALLEVNKPTYTNGGQIQGHEPLAVVSRVW